MDVKSSKIKKIPRAKDDQVFQQSSDCLSGQFSLEELSEDDAGYDGDIEILRPEYEDVESGNEDETHGDEGYDSADSEDQLAYRLRGLYCDTSLASSDAQRSPRKGKKRMSKDMEGPGGDILRHGHSDLEVMELSVHTEDRQPSKRRKGKATKSQTGERIASLMFQDRAENGSMSEAECTNPETSMRSTGRHATRKVPDEDMMDIG